MHVIVHAVQESTYVHHNIVEVIVQYSAAYCLIYDVTTYTHKNSLCHVRAHIYVTARFIT